MNAFSLVTEMIDTHTQEDGEPPDKISVAPFVWRLLNSQLNEMVRNDLNEIASDELVIKGVQVEKDESMTAVVTQGSAETSEDLQR